MGGVAHMHLIGILPHRHIGTSNRSSRSDYWVNQLSSTALKNVQGLSGLVSGVLEFS